MFERLYPRQELAVRNLWAKVDRESEAALITLLLVFATGSGKTKIAGVFASQRMKHRREAGSGPRVLFLCHHEEILERSVESFGEVFAAPAYAISGLPPRLALYKRGRTDWHDADVVFASFQALHPRLRNGTMPFGRQDFDLVVVDESHRGDAPTFREVVEYFRPNVRLGMTATPYEQEDRDTRELFGDPVDTYLLEDGIGDLLAELDYELVIDDLAKQQLRERLRQLNSDRGLVSVAELNRLFVIPERDTSIVQTLRRRLAEVENPKVIVFCPSTEYCDWLAPQLPGSVVIHSRGINKSTRKRLLRSFRRGEDELGRVVHTVLTVDWLNEGIDVPEANVGVFLRTTESERIWKQQLGRLLRRANGKIRATILDFAGNCERLWRVTSLAEGIARSKNRGADTRGLARVDVPAYTFNFDPVAVDVRTRLGQAARLFSRDRLLSDLRRFAARLDRTPSREDCEVASREEIASSATYLTVFGSWNAAIAGAGLEVNSAGTPAIPPETLLAQLQALARRLGRTPTPTDCVAAPRTEIASKDTFLRKFGSWPNALREAGLALTARAFTRERPALIGQLQGLARRLGRTPLREDCGAAPRTEIASVKTIVRVFGSWSEALRAAGMTPTRAAHKPK